MEGKANTLQIDAKKKSHFFSWSLEEQRASGLEQPTWFIVLFNNNSIIPKIRGVVRWLVDGHHHPSSTKGRVLIATAGFSRTCVS
jgi:hypothetical protein